MAADDVDRNEVVIVRLLSEAGEIVMLCVDDDAEVVPTEAVKWLLTGATVETLVDDEDNPKIELPLNLEVLTIRVLEDGPDRLGAVLLPDAVNVALVCTGPIEIDELVVDTGVMAAELAVPKVDVEDMFILLVPRGTYEDV